MELIVDVEGMGEGDRALLLSLAGGAERLVRCAGCVRMAERAGGRPFCLLRQRLVDPRGYCSDSVARFGGRDAS